MASYVSPKKGVEFIFYISLVSQANTKVMQSNPTIAAGDFKVSIDGGALANPATLPAVTPASSKMVKVTLSTSEMNGDNVTFVASDASGSEWCDLVVNIQTSARQIDELATLSAQSTMQTSIDDLPTNAELATSQAAADDATLAAIAALNNLSAAQVNAEVDTAIADAALATAANLATVDNVVDAILVDTAEIGAAGAGLTAVPWNADWDAQVQSEVQDAIEANHLDHLLAATYDPASKPGAADALLNELIENDGGVARYTANALEQGPSGSGASAADIADAVWEEAIADHSGTTGSTAEALNAAGAAGDPWTTALPGAYGAGSAGNIIGNNINATISSRATQTSVDDLPTNAELATSQAAADDATLAAIAALNNLSAAQVNAEVDTAISDAALATAANLATAQTAINDIPTNAELATALGTADDAVLAAIAALNNLSAAAVNAEVDSALADYDGPTHAELSTALAAADDAVLAAIAALNNLSAAQVNAEMLDVLTTDTFAEPGAVPAATSSLEDKISWLFTLARNKITQTATTQTLRNDADSADIATSTVSDDGTTAIRGEFS